MKHKTILFLTLALAFLAIAKPAWAQENLNNPTGEAGLATIEIPDWKVCNETSYVLDTAIAGVPKGSEGAPISIWGWIQILPGACKVVEVEKGTPRFVYARSASLHQGGRREWRGRFEYCVGDKDFIAKAGQSCELQNLKPAQFLQIVPTESRTDFVEVEDFGRRAETAGLQRLLKDNKDDIERMDGRTGRRTSKILRQFLKDHKLDAGISMKDKFNALMKFAALTRKTTGVRFCNKSSAKIWTALAFQKGANWESRGWWPVEKNKCIHPFAENIKKRNIHYYARMENGNKTDRILKAKKTKKEKPMSFCVGPSVFSALKHEFCRDQGYIAASFRPIISDKSGVVIELKDTDFSGASISGLR